TCCRSAVNRASLSFCATRRTRSNLLDTSCPALRPRRVSLAAFLLAGPLPSTASAAPPWALFGSFAGVGSGEAADQMAATSARPSEPLVQFSRKRLSPGIALLAVVALHARNQLQKVDQAQLPVEPPLRQLTPSSIAPVLVLVVPDAQHDPAVEAVIQPAHLRMPVVVAPPADDGVELV